MKIVAFKTLLFRIKLLIFLLVFCAPSYSFSSNDFTIPEQVVYEYVSLFQNGNFEQSATLLHPNFLFQYKKNVIEIINRVQKDQKTELLNNYGFKSIDDIKNTSGQEFYSIMMRERLKIKTDEDLKRYKSSVQKIKYEIEDKKLLENSCYKLLVSSRVTLDNKIKNNQLYVICNNNEEWKITNISVTN